MKEMYGKETAGAGEEGGEDEDVYMSDDSDVDATVEQEDYSEEVESEAEKMVGPQGNPFEDQYPSTDSETRRVKRIV